MAHSSAYSAIEIDDDDLNNATELQFQNFSSSDAPANAPAGNLSAANTPQPRSTGFGSSGIFEGSRPTQEQTANHPVWSLAYYAKFFDVDTAQVMERCFASVVPKDNFLEVMGGSPDLYGPFWIATTVIFVLFVTSSIVDSINAYINKTTYSYDIFQMTFAFGTIYTYAFLVPLLVWGATKYFGCQPDLLEMLSLYGYALTIWIPVSILSVIPIELARWILLGIGAGLSGVFLIRNMYPVLSRAEAQIAKIILILVIIFHGVLALILKYKFFAYNPATPPPTPSSTWNDCLTPYLFQRVTLPNRKQRRLFDKRASRPMISALQRNGCQIRTLICADNNAILRQISPQCTAVETLVLGSITGEVLPILRGCKDTLTRLEFTPRRLPQPSPQSLAQYMYLSTSLSSSTPNMLDQALAREILLAITDLAKLEHLVLDYLGIRSQEQLDIFFSFCQQLKALELHQCAVMGPAPQGMFFQKMESISLVGSIMSLPDQLMFMVQCPFLDHITWINAAHPLQLQSLGELWAMGQRELKSLDISNGIVADEEVASMLGNLNSLESFVARGSQFGPASLAALLEGKLKDQLQVLDLADCDDVKPGMVIEILTSCKALRSLCVDRIRAMDVIESAPWVCEDLETLRIVVVGPSLLSSNEIQSGVYSRIAKLSKLRLLSLGRYSTCPKEWWKKSVLDLSLANGLGRLEGLKELQEFDFCKMNHSLGMDEFKFMLRSWPKLAVMHGYLGKDEDRDKFFSSFIQNERPGIRLKHNLRYPRAATRWEY
ncbi:hypothetical protein BGX28_004060 [Mortierella sp. GBA30]|nr:hypothetical protein BGX28_004060 [Mortierella sp. GBA30]